MLRRIGADELKEWKAYYLLEPFGREWERFAHSNATRINVAGAYKDKPVDADDFMALAHLVPPLPPGLEREPQTVEEQIAIFDSIDAFAKGLDAAKAKKQ